MTKSGFWFQAAAVGVIGLILLGVSGCGNHTHLAKSSALTGAGLTKLRVGYPTGSLIKEIFLQTGVDTGIFTKYGLVVEEKDYPVGGQAVQDLASGNLDVAIVGPAAALAGAAQGADLKIIASGAENDCPLVVRPGITNIKELNGKKVGTPGASSIQETMLDYLEQEQGIKTKHVYAPIANLVQFMENGEIDGIVAWEPVAAETVAKVGAHYLMDTIIPGAEAADITVSGQLFRQDPATAVKFLKAAVAIRRYLADADHLAAREQVAAGLTGLPESVIANGVRHSNLFTTPLQLNLASIKLITSQDIASGQLVGVSRTGLTAFLDKNIDSTLLQKALH